MEAHLLPPQKKEKELLDKEIIEGLRNNTNDLRYFQEVFYRRYSGYLYRGITEKCRNFKEPEELAKDVMQESFKRIFKVINKFEFPVKAPVSEHGYIIKGWIGRFADKCFKKVYEEKVQETVVEVSTRSMDEVICPLCGEFLDEEKKYFTCRNKHYKIQKEVINCVALPEPSFDLFNTLYEKDGLDLPSEFRSRLQVGMNQLNEKQKHIILTYADEGCLSSAYHLSKGSLADLCRTYDTTPDNIKHIKNRALKHLKEILFSE